MIQTFIENGRTYAKTQDLVEWEYNKRDVSLDGLKRLQYQIEKLGQYKPLLIDPDGNVIGGNHRLKIYRKMGIENAWISLLDTTDKNRLMEYNLSDNDSVAWYLEDEIKELMKDIDIDISQFGINTSELDTLEKLLQQELTEVVEDEIPPVDEKNEPVSKLREVYQLGKHRLMCGDSTKIEDVEKLMDGQKADMVFTDPPYGYSYESNRQDKHKALLNDDKILDFLPTAYIATQDNSAYYIFCGWQTIEKWVFLVKESGLDIKNIIIWRKNNWSMGDLKGAYAGQYEMIIFAHKGKVELQGERERDVWDFDREPPKDHPTMKPVGLIAKAITKHLSNNILDLFGGSGSTLIACEQTNRTCYIMELDPKYCDVIRKRYAKFMNKEEEWESITQSI